MRKNLLTILLSLFGACAFGQKFSSARVLSAEPGESGILNLSVSYGGNDIHIPVHFADPVNDPPVWNDSTKVVLVTDEVIYTALDLSGVTYTPWRGLIKGTVALGLHSYYGQALDFARIPVYGVQDNVFYVTYTRREGWLAHNRYNYGNYLWGAAAHKHNVPLWGSCLGSHFNNMFLAPGACLEPDSPDDQLSIRAGYHSVY